MRVNGESAALRSHRPPVARAAAPWGRSPNPAPAADADRLFPAAGGLVRRHRAACWVIRMQWTRKTAGALRGLRCGAALDSDSRPASCAKPEGGGVRSLARRRAAVLPLHLEVNRGWFRQAPALMIPWERYAAEPPPEPVGFGPGAARAAAVSRVASPGRSAPPSRPLV